jgi:hypothetical protein
MFHMKRARKTDQRSILLAVSNLICARFISPGICPRHILMILPGNKIGVVSHPYSK